MPEVLSLSLTVPLITRDNRVTAVAAQSSTIRDTFRRFRRRSASWCAALLPSN
jgi:hypothetical protein